MKKKISKKIVALLTMAAFVLTLLPTAAFAVEVNGSTGAADVTLNGGTTQTIILEESNTATVSVKVQNANLTSDNRIYLWLVDETGAAQSTGIASVAAQGHTLQETTAGTISDWGQSWYLQSGNVGDTIKVTITFDSNAAGKTYTLRAANFEMTNYGSGDGQYNTLAELYAANGEDIGAITVVSTDAVANKSALLINGTDATASVEQGAKQEFTFDVRTGNGAATDYLLATTTYVWVENAAGEVVKDAVIATLDTAHTITGPNNGIYTISGAVHDEDAFTVMIPNKGDGYSLHASTVQLNVSNNKVSLAEGEQLRSIGINVTAKVFKTNLIVIPDTQADGEVSGNDVDGYTYTINDDVTPNEVKTYTVTGTAYQVDTTTGQRTPAERETLTISCANSNIKLTSNTVTTDADGNFKFSFTMAKPGSYVFTIAELNDQYRTTLTVVQDSVAPVDIKTVKTGGLVLAGNDPYYMDNKDNLFYNAVQFNIISAYGHVADYAGILDKEEAALRGANHADFLKLTPAEGSAMTANDLLLTYAGGNVYTLAYVGDSPAADLVPGEYKVEVSLNNGKKAVASFTVATFKDVADLAISLTAQGIGDTDYAANDNAINAITDQVALGQKVKGTLYLVDSQGLMVKAPTDNLSVGVNGLAVTQQNVAGNPISFQTLANVPANESLVGSTITIKALYNQKYLEKELTVVQNYLDETLAFSPVQGSVGEPNAVKVSVVDEGNNVSRVNGTMSATILSQSNEDANITLDVHPTVRNGQGTLYLESDAAGTVDVQVVVKAANGELYGKTFTFTFGDKDPYAGTTVVMTIGSAEYVVNNEVVTGDAEPYVNTDYRTMVPIRVLAETFGATVNYEAGVISIVDGDTTIVMTVGETAYTVNDEAATMDSAPVIGTGDRAYVPVRFVAEALGYDVTPLYDVETGLTASVVFQK